MRTLTLAVTVLAMVVSSQDTYFPKGALSESDQADSFKARWYSDQLRALEEPSLIEEAKDPSLQSYRFLWLRTFHHPVVVRLDITADGTGKLTVKIADGAGGYKPGKLIKNTSSSVATEETNRFLEQIKNAGFWELSSYEKTSGCDGAEWIIEGVKDGKYHVVNRWSPRNGPVRDLGMRLAFDLAHLKIPKDELY